MAWPLGYTILPMLPSGTATYAYGASGDGLVVVGEADDASTTPHAVYWTTSSGPIDLGTLVGGNFAYAEGTNSDGSVIVGFSNVGAGAGNNRGFRWTSAGGMVEMQPLPAGGACGAFGVSADGTVVVGQADAADTTRHAVRWDASGVLTDLGFLPGGTQSLAAAASSDGSVIVGYSNATDTHTHAVKWTGLTITDLGFLSGDTYSSATGVSADGSVIVGGGTNFAFRWTATSGMVSLGTLPGGSWSNALGVSADGNTVVGVGGDSTGQQRAWMWTQAGGMVELPDLTNASATQSYDGNGIAGNASVVVGEAPINVPTYPTGYSPIAVHFNGTFYAGRPDAPIFTTPVTTGVISSWIFGFANVQYFNISDSSGSLGGFTFRCDIDGVGSDVVFGANNSGTNLYSASFNFTQTTCPINVIISFDLSTQTVQCYVNDAVVTTTPDVSAAGSVTLPGSTTLAKWGSPVNPPPVTGYQADFWFGTTASFVDMSIASNRRKFINADLSPVDLGSTGQNPFGTSPEIYQSIRSGGVADDWRTNRGSAGGSFSDGTVNGQYAASTGTLSISGTPCDPSPITTAYAYGLAAATPTNNMRPRVALYW